MVCELFLNKDIKKETIGCMYECISKLVWEMMI
jgi:hypothetical protein